MARMPVKKRKRAPPKKTAFKKVKALVDRDFAADPEVEKDPFYIDPKSIPKGKAYQWVTTHILGRAQPEFVRRARASGWSHVKGHKPVGGQILMWAPKKVADAQRDKSIAVARQQMQDTRDSLHMDSPQHGVPFVPNSFLVSEPYETVPSSTPPIDVEVTTMFRLSGRLQDAAACIHISPEVYAQRRLALYLRGELGGILLPVYGSGGVGTLELFEGGNFSIQTLRK